jgi:hypothetical protein
VVAIGGLDTVAAFLATAQAVFFHEPGDAVASMAASFFAQLFLDAWTPIGLPALGMNLVDLLGQRLVLRGSRTGADASVLPGVVAARGNFQMQAERENRMFVFHRVDPFIPLEGGSERMPKVFF